MKKIWLGIGAAVIVILLLLQTRFSEYMVLQDSGFAMSGNSVKQMLMADILEGPEETRTSFLPYSVLDRIFKRGNQFYLGEKKKTAINLSYPFYINDCAGIYFLNDVGTLFDVNYDKASVYQGLRVTNMVAYNPGGERADATEYLFAGIPDGLFMNLTPVEFTDNGEARTIAANSVIYFTEEYFTFCEPDDGGGMYQLCTSIKPDSIVKVNGEECTYHELLIRLQVIYEKYAKQDKDKKDKDKKVEETPEPEEIDLVTDEFVEADATDLGDKTEQSPEKKPAKAPSGGGGQASKGGGGGRGPSAPRPAAAGGGSGDGGGGGKAPAKPKPPGSAASEGTLGVRPDEMRPDKAPSTDDGTEGDEEPVAPDYVKPEVSVLDTRSGVYRLMLDVSVYDPARRLHPQKKVQFEFYEQLSSGGELLGYRTYTGGSGTVTAGSGAIKPSTTYRVKAYFTYYDEYDDVIVEDIFEDMMTTNSFESLGSIDFVPINIDIFYDNCVIMPNVQYAETSDLEAVYGINNLNGIQIAIKGKGNPYDATSPVDSNNLRLFKNGSKATFTSSKDLTPNSNYTYEIELTDFFGNKLKVTNNTGDFRTCKSRPVGRMEIKRNVIGDIQMYVSMYDPDLTAIPSTQTPGEYEIYLVLSTEKFNPQDTPESIRERALNADDTDGVRAKDVHRFTPAEYMQNLQPDGTFELRIDETLKMETLLLNQRYFAYLFCDYDLENGLGPQWFGQVAEFSFTSASLNSLGRIYIKTDITQITCDSAVITYTLDTDRTNDTLESLLSDVTFSFVRTNGAEPVTDCTFTFDKKSMAKFSGYINAEQLTDESFADIIAKYPGVYTGLAMYETDPVSGAQIKAIPGTIMQDASYFTGESALQSKTDYELVPEVWATYDGVPYPMDVTLTTDTFKTLKKPADVEMKNVLFAAGHLIYDIYVHDPDEGVGTPLEGSIIGNTGHKVIMNVYQTNGKFVTAKRIAKEKWEHIDISNNIDIDKDYRITFIAQEYNEGYTNASFYSNYVIREFYIYRNQAIRISGDIKLIQLQQGAAPTGKLQADVKIDMRDDQQLLPDYKYYVSVEEDWNEDITADAGSNIGVTYPADGKWDVKLGKKSAGGDYDDATESRLHYDRSYYVKQGPHTYVMTLYTIINGQKLVIDTLEFSTEDVIENIKNAEEFVWKIKANPYGRFAVSENITLESSTYYVKPAGFDDGRDLRYIPSSQRGEGKSATPVNIVSDINGYVFNGQIDFQGYELNYNMNTVNSSSMRLFGSIGGNGELFNAVMNFKMDTRVFDGGEVVSEEGLTRSYDTGGLAYRNYGNIHDIELNYKGGQYLAHQYYGLLFRFNAVGGRIHNFVVANVPEDGLAGFTADYYTGMVCGQNYGIIQDGYVYGEAIDADVRTNSGNLYVGGIVGYNQYQGSVNNVFSLVNVIVWDPAHTANLAAVVSYGAIAGYDVGRIENAFSIGQSTYSEMYGGSWVNLSVGPAISNSQSRNKNIFYWNENNTAYPNFPYQRQLGLSTLYDYGWHDQLLGGQFDTSWVEVGYYPQVNLSSELPAQEALPLPERKSLNAIELMSSVVLDEPDEGNGNVARVLFRFYNPKNYDITGMTIEYLTVEFDMSTVLKEDGYTTVEADVKNPTKFLSSYSIINATYTNKGKATPQKFEPPPQLLVDFYRPVTSVNDWIAYVVKTPSENARLMNDLDFDSYRKCEMVVTSAYSGKLDGNDKTIRNLYIPGDSTSGNRYLFANLETKGLIKNLNVENIYVGYKNQTTEAAHSTHPCLIQNTYGEVMNVHVRGMWLKGYGYLGGITARSYAGSSITDSSVKGLTIDYAETGRCTASGAIGGIVGYSDTTTIRNCFVRNLNVSAMDMNLCQGVGGIAGYATTVFMDGVYATGEMRVRGSNVGGIAGYDYFTAETSGINNAFSKVDITGYQNYIGGIVGYINVYSALNSTNNVSGVAYGNVFSNNPDASGVSYEIGVKVGGGAVPQFYGSEVQSFNGILVEKGVWPANKKTATNILDTDLLQKTETYTNGSAMTNQRMVRYDFADAEDGFIPKLYYLDGHALLPGQDDKVKGNDRDFMNGIGDVPFLIKGVALNKNNRLITMTYKTIGEEKLIITKVHVGEKAKNNDLLLEDAQFAGNGTILFNYKLEQEQVHWLDSYWISKLTYAKMDDSGLPIPGTEREVELLKNPVQIPLTLYRDIPNADEWEKVMVTVGDKYENFRITQNVGFASGCNQVDTRLGRLIGEDASGAATSIVGLNLKSNNLVYRLNSELGNLKFQNCTVNSSGITYAGFVGSVYGRVHDVTFENSSVENTTTYTAMIGQLVSGTVDKVNLNNISVNTVNKGALTSVGGLLGLTTSGSSVKNVTGTSLNIYGKENVGGLFGYVASGVVTDISVEHVQVEATGSYVGGIFGRYTTGWSYNPGRFTVKGTPTFDANGHVESSTTVITSTGGTLVGGIAGRIEGSSNHGAHVDGIVVRGNSNNIGGAYGYVYSLTSQSVSGVTHVSDVKNVLIENTKAQPAVYTNVGGVAGDMYTTMNNCTVDNVYIKINNARRVGLVNGYRGGSGSTSNCVVKNSEINVGKVGISDSLYDVGGIVGRSETRLYECGVVNSVITAGKHSNVGGVAGYMYGQVDRCFYYGEPKYGTPDLTDSDPTAKAKYTVTGASSVGGVSGQQNYNQVAICYSNANVVATGKGAGGLIGYYRNNYTLNAKKQHQNSNVSLNRSYFTGTVTASDCAGGAIGVVGMMDVSVSTLDAGADGANHQKLAGRLTKRTVKIDGVDVVVPASGGANETAYTYQNIILAKSVTATAAGGRAYAFAGSIDGFEGKANTSGTNTRDVFRASQTYFWYKMEVGGTEVQNMLASDAPTFAQNTGYAGGKRFRFWSQEKTNANVRLIDLNDLKDKDMWVSIGWQTGDYTDPRGPAFYLFATGMTGKGGSASVAFDVGSLDSIKQKGYLPLIKTNGSTNAPDTLGSDYMIRIQAQNNVLLPAPGALASTVWLGEEDENSYVTVTPADADKINVEFSQNYVDNESSFVISCGGKAIGDPIPVERRVYTFLYDYGKNVKVEVTQADGANSDSINCLAAQLERHVMTWGNEYYYIPKEQNGIVHGTGSSVNGEGARTLAGDYITIYSGHALRRDGAVIDVSTGSEIGSVSGLTGGLKLLDTVTPMQTFAYSGMTVETYSRFSDIVGKNLVTREVQFLRSANGSQGYIDGTMKNVKDSLVLFTKDGKEHEIILGLDGIMVNLFGEDLCAPDDFRSSGIVYMTNNMNCSAPFILVEYGIRGSMVGYNYMTGEYLFNLYESNESLLDFAKRYFGGDKSMYDDAHLGYAANKEVIDKVGSADRLQVLVQGNSTMTGIDGNSTGENTNATDSDGERVGDELDRTDGNGKATEGYVSIQNQPEDGGVQTSEEVPEDKSGDGEGSMDVTTYEKEMDPVSEAQVSKEREDGLNNLEGGSDMDGESEAAEKGTAEAAESVMTEGVETDGLGQGDGKHHSQTAAAETKGSSVEYKDVVEPEDEAMLQEAEADSKKSDKKSDLESGKKADGSGEKALDDDGELAEDMLEDGTDGNGKHKSSQNGSGTNGSGVADPDSEIEADGTAGGTGSGSGSGTGSADGSGEGSGSGTGKTGGNKKASSGKTGEAGDETEEADGEGSKDTTLVQDGDVIVKSTAGTPVKDNADKTEGSGIQTPSNNINNGRKPNTSGEQKNEEDEEVSEEETKSKLITVYNQATGTFEIVDMGQYMTSDEYHSENVKLQVKDLGAYAKDAGIAEKVEEKQQANGLILYILVAMAVCTGTAGIIYFRRKQKL